MSNEDNSNISNPNVKEEVTFSSHEAHEVATSSDESEEINPIRNRPKRNIKPVSNEKDIIKFVDSDEESSSSDSDWAEGKDDIGEGAETDSNEDAPSGDNDSGMMSDNGESTVDESLEDEISNCEAPSNKDEDENEGSDSEGRERVTITKEEMPFLFENRGPGKRQIKVIQYKNDFIEKAEEMSSESSEDDEWKAKQDDIEDQCADEDLDVSNIPVDKVESGVAVLESQKSEPTEDVALGYQICGICLLGSEEDHIIECDKCGVTVHEGCYGLNISENKDDSDDFTWFCDPCVAGTPEQVYCELCPARTGAMKKTDAGKWAHVVCAFYTDGIGFGDTSRLEPIITTDIPPSRFGFNKCELCEDSKYAYSGLPIKCDAGCCKSYFHVTCAQRFGFLTEFAETEDDEEDRVNPFYAFCKIHVDKEQTRFYKRSFRQFQSHLEAFKDREISETTLEQLKAEQKRYREERAKKTVPAVMTERHPRALFGSCSAFYKLTRKADMYGLDTNVAVIEDDGYDRTMSKVKPDLSNDYVRYYHATKDGVKVAFTRNKELRGTMEENRGKEKDLQKEISSIERELPKLTRKYEKLRIQAEAIWRLLAKIDSKQFQVPQCLYDKPDIKVKRKVIQKKIGVKSCKECESFEEPYSMVDCDKCRSWYHFGCLDPPVTRNPKVSKAWSWFCSTCSAVSDDNNDTVKVIKRPTNNQKDSNLKATKSGRAVRKPHQFGCSEKASEGSGRSTPSKELSEEDEEQDSVLLYDSASFETLCEACSERDVYQKLRCEMCNLQFHLHCTAGSYEAGKFRCDWCDETLRIERAIERAETKEPESTPSNKKRKNFFELQYDLMQKRQKNYAPDLEKDQCKGLKVTSETPSTTPRPQILHQDAIEITQESPMTINARTILTISDGSFSSSVVTTMNQEENSQQITLEIAPATGSDSTSIAGVATAADRSGTTPVDDKKELPHSNTASPAKTRPGIFSQFSPKKVEG